MNKSNGFSLIEIMISIVILCILTIIALPVYTSHLVHGRRVLAASALMNAALAMEHYHLEHATYADATPEKLGLPEYIAEKNYRIHILSASETDYFLQAVPVASQATWDKECGILQLDAAGKKSVSGGGSLADCW